MAVRCICSFICYHHKPVVAFDPSLGDTPRYVPVTDRTNNERGANQMKHMSWRIATPGQYICNCYAKYTVINVVLPTHYSGIILSPIPAV